MDDVQFKKTMPATVCILPPAWARIALDRAQAAGIKPGASACCCQD